MVLRMRMLVAVTSVIVCASALPAQRAGMFNDGSDGPRPRLFGFALECEGCQATNARGLAARGPAAVWHYTSYPRVVAIVLGSAADRAGVKANDLVVAIDGLSLLSAEGGKRLSSVRPGDQVRLTLERDHKNLEVSLKLGTQLMGGRFGRPGARESPDSLTYAGHAGSTRVEVSGPNEVTANTDASGALVLHIAGNTVIIRPDSIPPPRTGSAAKRP